ncbi:MAG: alcohol dehydrogenase catalytic domain-containing protein, partial [Clostridia bacterium]|nr:alcohol dehydrogenase catalytic domain-containing protein [Clostridia bacterium]
MLSRCYSAAVLGVDGHPIIVECSVTDKLSGYEIVGLPDNAVKEAKERIHTAMENSGFMFPFGNIVINLAPADIKKTGSGYDLAILAGILNASGTVRANLLGDDTLAWNSAPMKAVFPRRLGYSSSGVVMAVGEAVTDLKEGDRVAVAWGTHSQYLIADS